MKAKTLLVAALAGSILFCSALLASQLIAHTALSQVWPLYLMMAPLGAAFGIGVVMSGDDPFNPWR